MHEIRQMISSLHSLKLLGSSFSPYYTIIACEPWLCTINQNLIFPSIYHTLLVCVCITCKCNQPISKRSIIIQCTNCTIITLTSTSTLNAMVVVMLWRTSNYNWLSSSDILPLFSSIFAMHYLFSFQLV